MTDAIQGRLLRWAAVFLFLYSTILTLSPAVRERSWDVDYRLSHWAGYAVWLVLIIHAHWATSTRLIDRDPYLLPAAAFMSGWGLLTIWRLDETFGLRQTIWLLVTVLAFVFALRIPQSLGILRRYKYVLLSSGLFLTALTLIFGTNPSGIGPRLWLGCCGVYFQPSEPLKLLLVIYLAAYLADHFPIRLHVFPLLFPTILVTSLALLLLIVQRDLGTASIFIVLYTVMLYIATGRRRVLIATAISLALALMIGYASVNIIHIRVDAWLDPWADPAGQSYQIVQSILAVANGGAAGRGPGLGSPGLVPVAISDFIYAAIAEETGLLGTIGLLALIWLIIARGLITAIRAPDRFRRFLAAGITTYLSVQSLLIIGGNLRLLPLTGVTLPFVSYGGSSLLTSFTALFLLFMIGAQSDAEPAPLPSPQPYPLLAGLLGLGLAAAAMTTAWWSVARSADLLTRTDNPRRAIADRYVLRGSLIDRNNQPINITRGESGAYKRFYLYPDLAPISGYTHIVYGQAGLEASLDDYLRGLKGNPASLIWWDHLLYGTPPPGLDIRLSIDLELQTQADRLLGGNAGAVLLLNAQSGEILAIASHPTFNPAQLDEAGTALAQDSSAPLVNRATQGLYPIGPALDPLNLAHFGSTKPDDSDLISFYKTLGLFQVPALNLPASSGPVTGDPNEVRVSPLQIAMAAASLSAHGLIPVPRIAIAVNTPEQGWVVLPASGQPVEVMQAQAAEEATAPFIQGNKSYWQHTAQVQEDGSSITWLLAGTLPDWQGTHLMLVLLLEDGNRALAKSIGSQMMAEALNQ